MMVRTIALALCLGFVGCASQKSQSAEPVSTTQTTSAALTPSTNEPYDPRFRVSDPIYESCQLASRQNLDIAEGTAYCMKSGALMQKRVRIVGEKNQVESARDRLVGNGVDSSRVEMVYSGGPPYVEIIEERR